MNRRLYSAYSALDENPYLERDDNVYRVMSMPGWPGNIKLIRVEIRKNGDKLITYKEVDNRVTPPELVTFRRKNISDADFAYFNTLLEKANFGDLESSLVENIYDAGTRVVDVIRNGKYHYIKRRGKFDNVPMMMAVGFLENCGLFGYADDPNLMFWPTLSYSAGYDRVCLDFSGQDLANREAEWDSWVTKTSFVNLFGNPHEVRTIPEGAIWGYYLRDRGMMVVRFGLDDKRNLKQPFLTYSEYGTPHILPEWLKSSGEIDDTGSSPQESTKQPE